MELNSCKELDVLSAFFTLALCREHDPGCCAHVRPPWSLYEICNVSLSGAAVGRMQRDTWWTFMRQTDTSVYWVFQDLLMDKLWDKHVLYSRQIGSVMTHENIWFYSFVEYWPGVWRSFWHTVLLWIGSGWSQASCLYSSSWHPYSECHHIFDYFNLLLSSEELVKFNLVAT